MTSPPTSGSRDTDAGRPLRILYGFSHYPDPADQGKVMAGLMQRLRVAGLRIDPFCLTLDPPSSCLAWRELDARWKRGDPALLRMYERLAIALTDYDVFVNGAGINLHPEMVSQLPVPSIYACFDDPESSEILSRPVAAAYDLALVGNIAELQRYRSWGCPRVEHWPLGFKAGDADPTLTEQDILEGHRDVAISMLCERVSPWRRERLDQLHAAFPEGRFHGAGWSTGFLPEAERVALYRRTRVGPNLHNSTGPVNARTFILPANGVLLVGDNRTHLGKLFALDREAVGFDSVDECIDRCRYYLAHDRERREIAAAGWRRAWADYHEIPVFRRLEALAQTLVPTPMGRKTLDAVTQDLRSRRWRRPLPIVVHGAIRIARNLLRPLKRRLLN